MDSFSLRLVRSASSALPTEESLYKVTWLILKIESMFLYGSLPRPPESCSTSCLWRKFTTLVCLWSPIASGNLSSVDDVVAFWQVRDVHREVEFWFDRFKQNHACDLSRIMPAIAMIYVPDLLVLVHVADMVSTLPLILEDCCALLYLLTMVCEADELLLSFRGFHVIDPRIYGLVDGFHVSAFVVTVLQSLVISPMKNIDVEHYVWRAKTYKGKPADDVILQDKDDLLFCHWLLTLVMNQFQSVLCLRFSWLGFHESIAAPRCTLRQGEICSASHTTFPFPCYNTFIEEFLRFEEVFFVCVSIGCCFLDHEVRRPQELLLQQFLLHQLPRCFFTHSALHSTIAGTEILLFLLEELLVYENVLSVSLQPGCSIFDQLHHGSYWISRIWLFGWLKWFKQQTAILKLLQKQILLHFFLQEQSQDCGCPVLLQGLSREVDFIGQNFKASLSWFGSFLTFFYGSSPRPPDDRCALGVNFLKFTWSSQDLTVSSPRWKFLPS